VSEDLARSVKEGQLKPTFAGNVGIPLAGARRMRQDLRKAKYISGADYMALP